MRISDWSSDVCSSDIARNRRRETTDCGNTLARHADRGEIAAGDGRWRQFAAACDQTLQQGTRRDNGDLLADQRADAERSEEHTSELQSLMRISYAVFCLKKKNTPQ